MQRTVLTFGLIAGFIILLLWYATLPIWMGEDGKMDMSTGELLGYTNMLIALSMIFFGIRQFRDRHLGGKITFGKAFKVGFLITLTASVIYVIGWMVYYEVSDFAQTFPPQYLEYMKEKWTASGMSPDQIGDKAAGFEKNMEMYNNPVIRVGMTLIEILPVGLLVTLISALILKRK